MFMDIWKLFVVKLNSFNNVSLVLKRSGHDIGAYSPLYKYRETLQQVL